MLSCACDPSTGAQDGTQLGFCHQRRLNHEKGSERSRTHYDFSMIASYRLIFTFILSSRFILSSCFSRPSDRGQGD